MKFVILKLTVWNKIKRNRYRRRRGGVVRYNSECNEFLDKIKKRISILGKYIC